MSAGTLPTMTKIATRTGKCDRCSRLVVDRTVFESNPKACEGKSLEFIRGELNKAALKWSTVSFKALCHRCLKEMEALVKAEMESGEGTAA